ncbi:uncharacterized protein [Littorina saxatilis]|uniref:Fucolectin tachylectin-4 pentraxin-1 domain-containing protein n=1 Tax=Littorina saxatilis TaxID=31220 RepID=A0AAN9ASN1_9CAEN
MTFTGIGALFFCLCWLIASAVGETFENVAINKTYNQTSKHGSQGLLSAAANGDTGGNYFDNNCIHTDQGSDQNHWWEVNLLRKYPVRDITVWARRDFCSRLYPFTITVDNQICVNVTSAPSKCATDRRKSVTCSSVTYGQVIRLTLNRIGQDLKDLNLCEFQIFVPSGVSQCPVGRHGAQCGQKCSDNCGGGPGKNFCDQHTGVCYDGCTGNFSGDFCPGCRPGYYEAGCTSRCSSLVSGCTQCTQNGRCTACTGQFAPPACTECQPGQYGKECSRPCGYCQVNTTCHREDGRCLVGCVSGFLEPFCQQVKQNSLVVPVVCSVIGAAVIIAIAVVAAGCMYRRSRGGPARRHDRTVSSPEPGCTQGHIATKIAGHKLPSSPTPRDDTAHYGISDTTNAYEMYAVENNYDKLYPYSNDDADRQPYTQMSSQAFDVTKW